LPVVSSENRCRAGGLVCKRQRADGFRARRRAGGCSLARDRSERSAAFLLCTAALQSATTPDCAMMRDGGGFSEGCENFC